jgi:hypothetical protein
MNKFILAIAVFSVLSACSGGGTNPFTEPEEDTTVPDEGTPITGDRTLPPGTTSPTPDHSIFRSEPTTGGHVGDGFANGISYNDEDDTFTVDNLAFDGDNIYDRGTAVGSLGPYSVYEAASQYTDTTTGSVINQFTHRAIYGVSSSASTQFAIVRTGAYLNYGFGGFVYQRNGSVTLPTTGQALYQGTVAGLRDFDDAGGLEYTTGDIQIAIDFEDFNATTGLRGDAVSGQITNRRIYDINGADITQTVLTRIEDANDITLNTIPIATFVISPNAMDNNGQIIGNMTSSYTNSSGDATAYETGNYYALVSGDNAEEIVGIVVLESTIDPIGDVRETGGFIVYR